MRTVIAVTGGGSGAISTLLGEPGASRSILAATVPYAPEALIEWLSGKPDEFCSQRTARAMAMAAYFKAGQYDPRATTCGVGCTASLASDRPKRGPHRIHVAWQTADTTAAYSLELEKGRRTRAEEEAIASALVLNAIAEACGAMARVELPLAGGEHVKKARVEAPADQQDLLAGRTALVPVGAAQKCGAPLAVLPGAFNPLHQGHRKMAAAAAGMLGCDVALEISIDNVDKPPLDFIEIADRLRQFTAEDAVWLTRAATFAKKAQLFPGATFVVGADTIERIGHERYYGHPSARDSAIESIAEHGCRFLVFGRAIGGRFRTLDDLHLPKSLARLCRPVPKDTFREDISSTQLRAGQSGVAPGNSE
jgi:nicotinic acid mononucleotide adenylyltransferase/nicotinamide mononucleotide (NMN) deamidase PncC